MKINYLSGLVLSASLAFASCSGGDVSEPRQNMEAEFNSQRSEAMQTEERLADKFHHQTGNSFDSGSADYMACILANTYSREVGGRTIDEFDRQGAYECLIRRMRN